MIRILYVEDDVVSRLVVQALPRQCKARLSVDVSIDIATTIAEAIATAHGTEYDAVLLDMVLDTQGATGGLRVAKAIRRAGKSKYASLIACTNMYGVQGFVALATKAGIDYFIPKPITADDFVRLVSEAVLARQLR